MKKTKNEKKGIFLYAPLWTLIFFGIAALALAAEILSRYSVGLADFVSGTFGKAVRTVMAYATYIFPFSVAEMLLWFSPVILGVIIYLAVKCVNRSWQSFSRFVAGLLAIASMIYSMFVCTLGTAYYGTKVADKMGIARKNVSAEELYDTVKQLVEVISAEIDKVHYPEGTYSVMPYSYEEMNKKLNDAFAVVCEKYDGIDSIVSRTKPVILSPYWTYTHISGLYTFFTGEANVNTNYPDVVMVSSAAHELAHQRGVVSEDEANFVAFMVCLNSDDPFIRYAGCMDVYQDLTTALYSASPELYMKLWSEVPKEVTAEYNAYSEFFDKYRENVAADVAGSMNNAYIENHNQPAGVKSYGMVVDLVVSYMLYGDQ